MLQALRDPIATGRKSALSSLADGGGREVVGASLGAEADQAGAAVLSAFDEAGAGAGRMAMSEEAWGTAPRIAEAGCGVARHRGRAEMALAGDNPVTVALVRHLDVRPVSLLIRRFLGTVCRVPLLCLTCRTES